MRAIIGSSWQKGRCEFVAGLASTVVGSPIVVLLTARRAARLHQRSIGDELHTPFAALAAPANSSGWVDAVEKVRGSLLIRNKFDSIGHKRTYAPWQWRDHSIDLSAWRASPWWNHAAEPLGGLWPSLKTGKRLIPFTREPH